MKKAIHSIQVADKVNMGGILLDQPLPNRTIESLDPFLLIHHWENRLTGGQSQSEVGVGPHPHRGFSPVTFVFKGNVHHRDSLGNDSIVHAGGTQWMNSGKGLVHSERPSVELAQEGGDFELIQFWVNVPAANKMDPPEYIPLHAEDTPIEQSADGRIKIGVVSGKLNALEGPVASKSELIALRLEFSQGEGKHTLSIPAEHNTLIYLLNGDLTVNDQKLPSKGMLVFENEGEKIHMHSNGEGRAILLSGVPLNEPLATYGPFVMNSQSEIIQALNDFQEGRMGSLDERFD